MAPAPGGLEPGVLPHQEIIELCGLGGNQFEESQSQGPIQPCRRQNVRSASYDLRLGREYHFSDGPARTKLGVRNMQVARLHAGSDEHIVLPPNQVVVASCLEKICLPDDMVGHLTLKQDILLQGLIMASQSQIDAGYHGWIYPLLYNLTDGEVLLRLNSSVIRLELVRLAQATDKPYEGDYQGSTLSESLKRPIGSSLTDLKREVEQRGEEIDEERRRFNKAQVVASFFAIFLTIAALAFPLAIGWVGDIHSTQERVSRLEGDKSEQLKLEGKMQRLKSQMDELQCQILEQEGRPKPSRC